MLRKGFILQIQTPLISGRTFASQHFLSLRKIDLKKSVWWNYEDVIHFELIPNGESIKYNLYSAQLDRMYGKLKEKYRSLVNLQRVFLQ